MPDATSHIKLIPLEQLFQRLELAGFKISPADRLRAIKVLGGPGKEQLKTPEKLRDILAPILVRNKEEQQKFYEIFDYYYQDISTLPEPDENNRYWPWWVRFLLVIPLLLLLLGGYYKIWQDSPIPKELVVSIDGPRTGIEGDTIKFYNQSRYTGDSSELRWQWSFHDLANQKIHQLDSVNFHFPVIITPIADGSFLREVRLEVYSPETDSVYKARHSFKVICPDQPLVGGIKVREQSIEAGQNVNFSTLSALPTVQAGGQRKLSGPAANWHFKWEYGDGESMEGSFFAVHQYERNGQYQVKLTVTDTSSQAFCSVEHKLDVKVGQDQAYLPLAGLYRDSSEVLAVWSWGYYLLLGALGLGLLYYWLRWLVNRPDDAQQQKEKRKDKALFARFAHSDKGPYYIPFRNQSSLIHTSNGQLRLADAMRLRQDGLRQEISIRDTLKATIEQGGFPEVRFRYASQASEYLILVDEQNLNSHLGHLFKYLANSLRGQDVNVDIYYYRKHFTRFWNHYYPQGLDLDQLHRSHGHYRLLVMGDLHEMIDPHTRNQPSLRSAQANVLRQWSQRLLLTPVPPVSWTYREKLLARVFNVFPADNQGLSQVAIHLENNEELLPDGAAFDRWKELQIDTREDQDTEYRKWRRWPAIQEYLQGCHTDVERWFKALAVFPAPSWPITIAIGQALGIQITHNKLLQLARIPVLQAERFDEKLRQKLLTHLSAHDEQIARQTLQHELGAVKTITAGSHAMQELETSLAIQTFALEPLEENSRDAIRFLLRENLLTKAQEIELDRVADSHFNPIQEEPVLKQKAAKKQTKRPKFSIRQWLAEEGETLPPPAPKEDAAKRNRHLRKAVLYTLAYLALLVFGWKLGGTDALYKTVFQQDPENRPNTLTAPLKDYVFVKEAEVVDSAIIYNNLGVDNAITQTASDTLAIPYFDAALERANILIHGDSYQFNGKEISYALANTNRAKVFYNSAVSYFNNFQEDSLGQAILPEALSLLDSAYTSANIALDVLHARGIIHYYLGSPEDSIYKHFQYLDSLAYFDRLTYSPNLKTLSGRSRSAINKISIAATGNQALNVTVDYFVNSTVDKGVEIIIAPIGRGNQPDTQQKELFNGTNSAVFRFNPNSDAQGASLSQFNVQLRQIADRSIIDTKVEAYSHNWTVTRSSRDTRPKDEPDKQTTVDTNEDEPFQFRGQVIDPITRKPIVGALIELKEQATRATGSLVDLSTYTDDYGEFSLEGNFQRVGPANVNVTASKDGYQNKSETYTKQQLTSFSPKETVALEMNREIAYPKMLGISGGDFTMGTDEYGYPTDPSSAPAHNVTLSNFSISAYEVTFTQYDYFCEATQREKPDDYGWGRGNRPVINVSWYDAIEFCNWLSEQAGYQPAYQINMGKGQYQSVRYLSSANGYRLPTEAEWEYAAMGGPMKNVSQIYSGSNDLDLIGWYDGNSVNQTHSVGGKKPNNAGIYDMSGNVWEWCTDVYSEYPSTPQTNPAIGPPGSHRMIRGGAWIQGADDCRIKVRQYRLPTEKEVITGFRIARSGR